MTVTTNTNWAPLERKLKHDANVIREFMWMYGDEETGVEYYKHTVTRRYPALGWKAFGAVEGGRAIGWD